MSVTPISMLPTCLEDLPFSEKLMVWAMRTWVCACREGQNPVSQLHAGFRLAHAGPVMTDVARVMGLMSTEGAERLHIRAVQHSQVSLGEQRVLAALAAYQHGARHTAADLYLSWWLTLPTIRALRDPLWRLAEALGHAELFLRPRRGIRIDGKALAHAQQLRETGAVHPPAEVHTLYPRNNVESEGTYRQPA